MKFIKNEKYEVTRRIDAKTNYMKYIQGATETLVAVCTNVTEQYATFSIEGKEDIKRMKWSGKDGVERVNYLKRTGIDMSDCISSANIIEIETVEKIETVEEVKAPVTKTAAPRIVTEAEAKQGAAIAKFCYEHKKPVIRVAPARSETVTTPDVTEEPKAPSTDGGVFAKGQTYKILVGINQDEKVVEILGRTDRFAEVRISGTGNIKTTKLIIRQPSQGELISIPGSQHGNDIIKAYAPATSKENTRLEAHRLQDEARWYWGIKAGDEYDIRFIDCWNMAKKGEKLPWEDKPLRAAKKHIMPPAPSIPVITTQVVVNFLAAPSAPTAPVDRLESYREKLQTRGASLWPPFRPGGGGGITTDRI